MANRTTQVAVEVLAKTDSNAVVSQLAVEVLRPVIVTAVTELPLQVVWIG